MTQWRRYASLDSQSIVSDLSLAIALAVIAALFAAIGQAGGAGYVAVLAVGGQAPDAIRPAALLLTLLVAGIGVLTTIGVILLVVGLILNLVPIGGSTRRVW